MAEYPVQRTLHIGTRASPLARWQAEHVAALLRKHHPGLGVEIKLFATRGDRLLETPLPQIGGKGVFTEEIERALRHKEIDLAVHSLKDLPTADSEGLRIGAIPQRADARDALVIRGGVPADARERSPLAWLARGAVIGTSSLRRESQLVRLRPDLRVRSVRGNVDTRLGKVQRGEYNAVILACAGLDRLGMDEVIAHRMSVEQMMPAPGQGALAVQCRDENAMIDLLAPLNHHETALCACAEREFLAALGGGCALPVAALATVRLRELHLRGRVVAADGSGQIDVEAGGPLEVSAAKEAGRQAAELAMVRGARELLRREATS